MAMPRRRYRRQAIGLGGADLRKSFIRRLLISFILLGSVPRAPGESALANGPSGQGRTQQSTWEKFATKSKNLACTILGHPL